MIIDLESLNCAGCPAVKWKNRQISKIKKWEIIREEVTNSLSSINLYLLCESIPFNRFFYDKSSDYTTNGLRYNLRLELVPRTNDEDLFNYMHGKAILLVDCALCPLHKLPENTDKILAATLCLKNNTRPYLNLNNTAPIITIFPYQRGFAQNIFPEIEKRIINKFQFSRLGGLKTFIEDHFKKIWN